jgi:ParB family chromosome partitioning protein
LADVFGLSHTQVAKKVGRSREYVSNTIRLLALPDYMLSALRTADISEGHARTLLMLNDRPEEQDTVFREILLKKLSVREVERIARGIASEKIRKKGDYDADLIELEKKFTETLGTRVSIVKTEFGGRLSIDYFTQEDLEMMLVRMHQQAVQSNDSTATPLSAATDIAPYTPVAQLADPRADDLLILTESTGLESLSTSAPGIPVSAIETETSVPMPVVLARVESDPAIIDTEFSNAVDDVATAVVAEISDEPLNANAMVASVSPAPDSFREQLAALISVTQTPPTDDTNPTIPEAAIVPAAPVMLNPVTAVPVEPETDESGLYNLKNFSI